jgi:hypothetical protein
VQAKLEREATLNKFQASRILRGGSEDLDVDVCDAESQTVCSCQQVRIRRPTDSDHSRVTLAQLNYCWYVSVGGH